MCFQSCCAVAFCVIDIEDRGGQGIIRTVCKIVISIETVLFISYSEEEEEKPATGTITTGVY